MLNAYEKELAGLVGVEKLYDITDLLKCGRVHSAIEEFAVATTKDSMEEFSSYLHYTFAGQKSQAQWLELKSNKEHLAPPATCLNVTKYILLMFAAGLGIYDENTTLPSDKELLDSSTTISATIEDGKARMSLSTNSQEFNSFVLRYSKFGNDGEEVLMYSVKFSYPPGSHCYHYEVVSGAITRHPFAHLELKLTMSSTIGRLTGMPAVSKP